MKRVWAWNMISAYIIANQTKATKTDTRMEKNANTYFCITRLEGLFLHGPNTPAREWLNERQSSVNQRDLLKCVNSWGWYGSKNMTYWIRIFQRRFRERRRELRYKLVVKLTRMRMPTELCRKIFTS